jgi:hypothetical protein
VAVFRLLRHMYEAGVPRVYLLLHINAEMWNSTVAGRLSMSQHVGGFHGRLPHIYVSYSPLLPANYVFTFLFFHFFRSSLQRLSS